MATPDTDPRSPTGASEAHDRDSDDDKNEPDNGRRRPPAGEEGPEDDMGAELDVPLNAQTGIDAQLANNAAEAAAVQAEAANIQSRAQTKPPANPPNAVQDEDISMDFDQEPEPIPTHGSTGGLFPGVECKTVAILAARGGGYRYINRYGPVNCPWFVIADSSYDLPSGQNTETLINNNTFQCVTDANSRVIDYPYKQTEKHKKPKSEDIQGILHVVADLPLDVQSNPLEAIKELDPTLVKCSDKYKDLDLRKQAVKQGEIGKYPSTYLYLQFKNDVLPSNLFSKNRSWELSSKFRGLHSRKSQLSTEETIYRAYKQRGVKFLGWYKAKQPEDYKKFEEQAEPITALERTPSKSPLPVPVPNTTPVPKTKIKTKTKTKSAPQVRIKEEPQSPQAVSAIAPLAAEPEPVASGTSEAPAENPENQTTLSEERQKRQAELAWRMISKFPSNKILDAEDKQDFNFWYKLMKSQGAI